MERGVVLPSLRSETQADAAGRVRDGGDALRGRDQPALPNDGYLPLRRLAVYSGLSVRTLRNYLTHSSRPLPHYRIGGKILVRQSDYDGWALAFRTVASDQISALVADALEGLR
jgi:hypothetical protein